MRSAHELPLVMLVVGARPNFVKAAPILAAMEATRQVSPLLVHTGQHYDEPLSGSFFRDLEITVTPIHLGVGSGTHAQQTGTIMTALEEVVGEHSPDMVMTVGDVNSTLAAALVAAKAGVPQAHVEAGLRSGDPGMPEEVNRVVADRLADVLLTHSEDASANLLHEGVSPERIRFVGNVMIDTLVRLRTRWQGHAQRSVGPLPDGYGVVTLHRPSNVDDPSKLLSITEALDRVADSLPLIFPVHPRTRLRLNGRPGTSNLRIVEPMGYLAFLDLIEHARVVLTDSGGIQEETSVLGVPCLTLRDSTERPVTTRLGTNRLLGTDPRMIEPAVADTLASPPAFAGVPPLWDGHAAERVVGVVAEWLAHPRRLRLAA